MTVTYAAPDATGGSSTYPIVIGSVEHGKLTANKTTATAGAEVTITAKPTVAMDSIT